MSNQVSDLINKLEESNSIVSEIDEEAESNKAEKCLVIKHDIENSFLESEKVRLQQEQYRKTEEEFIPPTPTKSESGEEEVREGQEQPGEEEEEPAEEDQPITQSSSFCKTSILPLVASKPQSMSLLAKGKPTFMPRIYEKK